MSYDSTAVAADSDGDGDDDDDDSIGGASGGCTTCRKQTHESASTFRKPLLTAQW